MVFPVTWYDAANSEKGMFPVPVFLEVERARVHLHYLLPYVIMRLEVGYFLPVLEDKAPLQSAW